MAQGGWKRSAGSKIGGPALNMEMHQLFAAQRQPVDLSPGHRSEVGRVGGHLLSPDEVRWNPGQRGVLLAEIRHRETSEAAVCSEVAQLGAAAAELRPGRKAVVLAVWEPVKAIPFLGVGGVPVDQEAVDAVMSSSEGGAGAVAAEGAALATQAGFDTSALVKSGDPAWQPDRRDRRGARRRADRARLARAVRPRLRPARQCRDRRRPAQQALGDDHPPRPLVPRRTFASAAWEWTHRQVGLGQARLSR